jgi:hypothetical protein
MSGSIRRGASRKRLPAQLTRRRCFSSACSPWSVASGYWRSGSIDSPRDSLANRFGATVLAVRKGLAEVTPRARPGLTESRRGRDRVAGQGRHPAVSAQVGGGGVPARGSLGAPNPSLSECSPSARVGDARLTRPMKMPAGARQPQRHGRIYMQAPAASPSTQHGRFAKCMPSSVENAIFPWILQRRMRLHLHHVGEP